MLERPWARTTLASGETSFGYRMVGGHETFTENYSSTTFTDSFVDNWRAEDGHGRVWQVTGFSISQESTPVGMELVDRTRWRKGTSWVIESEAEPYIFYENTQRAAGSAEKSVSLTLADRISLIAFDHSMFESCSRVS